MPGQGLLELEVAACDTRFCMNPLWASARASNIFFFPAWCRTQLQEFPLLLPFHEKSLRGNVVQFTLAVWNGSVLGSFQVSVSVYLAGALTLTATARFGPIRVYWVRWQRHIRKIFKAPCDTLKFLLLWHIISFRDIILNWSFRALNEVLESN